MAAPPAHARKLLALLTYLLRYSDEQHPRSMEDILAELERHGLSAERKAIYTYLNAMKEQGVDVRSYKPGGWYIGKRDFTLPEVKMLVDAVQASQFLSRQETDVLIHKLENLVSVYEANRMQRQVVVTGRPKVSGHHLYETIDQIHTAVSEKLSISFLYFDYDYRHRKIYRHHNKVYVVSPYGLIWNSERYYMAAYTHDTKTMRTYRVDKMDNVKLLPIERKGQDRYPDFSLARYEQQRFNMFGGEETRVVLRGKKNIASIVWDRFGPDVVMVEDGPYHFRFTITLDLSPHFYGWLLGMEGDLIILEPQEVVKEYQKLLIDTLQREQARATQIYRTAPEQQTQT